MHINLAEHLSSKSSFVNELHFLNKSLSLPIYTTADLQKFFIKVQQKLSQYEKFALNSLLEDDLIKYRGVDVYQQSDKVKFFFVCT